MAMIVFHILIPFIGAINLLAFTAMGADKRRARKGKWRIPERTLFVLALLGGSVGALAGMYIFRHKTKYRKFVVGIPAILVLQLVAVCYAAVVWQ